MTITLLPDAGLAGNSAAFGAFQRAADTWSSVFTDPITVSIVAGLTSLPDPLVIGSASPTLLTGGYTLVRNAMVTDAADEASNAIVAALPTAAQFTAQVAQGFTVNNALVLSSANAKALGFAVPAGNDGTITFNSSFAFDYDNSDGVGAGLVDFESVALHEIGHILGFLSSVDDVDERLRQGQPGAFSLTTLDLFRFSAANAPTNAATMTSNARSLVPGAAAVFSDAMTNWVMSTGVNFGDGRQASHWKDDELTGTLIGTMDPTLPSGTIFTLSAADLRSFDLIGYDLNTAVPEPGTFVAVGLGLGFVGWQRRRKAGRAARPTEN